MANCQNSAKILADSALIGSSIVASTIDRFGRFDPWVHAAATAVISPFEIQPGDTVAIWGCGPVGQFAIRSAFMLGFEWVIAIDYK